MFGRVEEVHVFCFAVSAGKGAFLHLPRLIFLLPLGLEAQGVDEIYRRQRGDFLQYITNHAVGVGFNKTVDVADGGFIKGGCVGGSVVVIGDVLQKTFLHRQAVFLIPQPNGVGEVEGALVLFGIFQQPCEEGVPVGCGAAEGIFHLLQGVARCAVHGHTEGVENGEGRDQPFIAILHVVLQEGEAQRGGSACAVVAGGGVG